MGFVVFVFKLLLGLKGFQNPKKIIIIIIVSLY